MLTIDCPCCSYPLLRHIRAAEVYWYCSHCHQEMPPSYLNLGERHRLESSISLTKSIETLIPYPKPKTLVFGA